MNESPYVTVLSEIKKGETRTFGEVARLAGKPGGARAAGRVVSSYPADGRAAWQRAVTADGGLSIDPDRAELQLERLRKEGARPKDGESNSKWAKRVGASWVGNWRNRRATERSDPRVEDFDPRFVERFESAEQAAERGFEPLDGPPEKSDAPPATAPSRPRAQRSRSVQRASR